MISDDISRLATKPEIISLATSQSSMVRKHAQTVQDVRFWKQPRCGQARIVRSRLRSLAISLSMISEVDCEIDCVAKFIH